MAPFDSSAYGIDSLWLKPEPAPRSLLIAYPHPDDETFGNAGIVARYAAEGVAVHYACATRGEVGTVTPELLGDYPDAGALRTDELACAARTLNMAGVHFLNYRDSGMQGAPDNQHPGCLVQAPLDAVAGKLVALMRALRPQVVLTFGPYGGYGHPDHIKIHHATHAAFAAAGDPARYPEQIAAGLAPWQPQKLYYSTFSTRVLKIIVSLSRFFGQDPRRGGRNQDIDFVEALDQATAVTTTVDTGAYEAQKLAAFLCHRSQLDGMGLSRLPAPVRRMWLGREQFTRVAPPWDGRTAEERDLFEGLA
jgi:LmbE family N-acetylglucosaminyl deacetylase